MARVIELEAHKKLEDLQRVLSTINKVTHEYIMGLWYFTSFSKEF
jgi:hypothetical protein